MTDVAAVVVHHKRHGDIGAVIRSLSDAGIDPDRILVVDNSEVPELEAKLSKDVQPAHLLVAKNRGYGSAVNDGLALIDSRWPDTQFVLVATHEVSIDAASLSLLRDTLVESHELSAVGPTLLRADSRTEQVWSQGERSRHLGGCQPTFVWMIPVPTAWSGIGWTAQSSFTGEAPYQPARSTRRSSSTWRKSIFIYVSRTRAPRSVGCRPPGHNRAPAALHRGCSPGTSGICT